MLLVGWCVVCPVLAPVCCVMSGVLFGVCGVCLLRIGYRVLCVVCCMVLDVCCLVWAVRYCVEVC